MVLLLVAISDFMYAQCESDLQQDNVKGKVKTIIEKGIYVENGANEVNSIKTTSYDNKGKSTGYIFAHKNDNLKPSRTVFEFDTKGRKVKENRFDVNGKLEYYLTFEYDPKGNVTQSKLFFASGDLDSYQTFKYNSNCGVIESRTFYSDGGLWLAYAYNYKNGLKTDGLDLQDSSSFKYAYDKHGNLVEYAVFTKDGKKTTSSTYAYEYDAQLNWTKKTTYQDGKIYWVEERQYEYYPKQK